jgi:hypothetical protein
LSRNFSFTKTLYYYFNSSTARTKNIVESNNNTCNNNNNNNGDASIIQIFEDKDPSLSKVFTVGSVNNANLDVYAKSGNHICTSKCILGFLSSKTGNQITDMPGKSESRLNAHVCYNRCGLGPEYLQFVKNTNL